MQEPLEFIGFWWLPDDPDKQLPGTLTFSQEEGAVLELVGVFGTKETKRVVQPTVVQPTIILGVNQKGKAVTLYGCQNKSWIYPLVGLGGAKYRADFVYEGVHFEKEDDIKFNQLCGNYTDLDAWVDIFGFSIDRYQKEGQPLKATIEYVKPDNQLIQINDDFEVGIGFSSFGPNWSIIQTEVKITQRAYFVIKSLNGDIPFHELFSLLDKFSDLLLIAVQRITYPVTIFGFTELNGEQRGEGKEPHYPEVNIYFHPIASFVERKSKLPQEMLFTFKDLEEEQLRQWFESFDTHKTEIKLYRTLFYSGRLFIETRFLNIAQALESLHSILFDKFYLPKDEFKAKRDLVVNSVPANLQDWVKGALSNANYKRFKEKIVELLENKSSLFARCIEDNDAFAKRVRDTRNEFVHHNEMRWTFRDREELMSAIYLLTYLFEAYMLAIIGFPKEQINEIYNKRIDRYLSRWKKL